MHSRDRLLALLVAVCWGLNFPVTAIALEHFPPFLLVAVRFTLLAVPTVLFVPRPQIPWIRLLRIGATLAGVQFAFLYLALRAGLPAGLASIILQASAPLTVIIAAVWLRERITRRQLVGILLALVGLAIIAVYRSQTAAFLPVLLCLIAALGWAYGNVAVRQAAPPNPLHLTLWMSIVPPVPLFALSLIVEGPDEIGRVLRTSLTLDALPSVLALLYLVLIASVVGYGIWTTLLSRHPSSTVAPFSMLVPVIGVLSSWLAFGEVPAAIELAAGAVVIAGVVCASTGGRITAAGRSRRYSAMPLPTTPPSAPPGRRAMRPSPGRRSRPPA